ncbi:PAAR domain-containing protein [Vibrio parahaemolyticus]|nr:PAAR domain-containing protein [Vibrio parahaemolyticus]
MGKPAALIGSMHVCPKVTAKVPHVGGPVVGGSPNVKIGGLPAARMGDGTAHGGKIVIGNPTVTIGDGGLLRKNLKLRKLKFRSLISIRC